MELNEAGDGLRSTQLSGLTGHLLPHTIACWQWLCKSLLLFCLCVMINRRFCRQEHFWYKTDVVFLCQLHPK